MDEKFLDFKTQVVAFIAGISVGISFMLVVVSIISAVNNG